MKVTVSYTHLHRISWHTPINSVSSCFFVGFSEYTDGCRTILSSTELQYYIARQYTKHMPKHKAGPGTGFYDPNRPPQREQFAISNSVSGIPFRHNRTFACFCARLFVSLPIGTKMCIRDRCGFARHRRAHHGVREGFRYSDPRRGRREDRDGRRRDQVYRRAQEIISP